MTQAAIVPNAPDRLDRLDEYFRLVEEDFEEQCGFLSVPVFADYAATVSERMIAGAKEYGDYSFRRHPLEILHELSEEAADLGGWGYVLFVIADTWPDENEAEAFRMTAIALGRMGAQAMVELEVTT